MGIVDDDEHGRLGGGQADQRERRREDRERVADRRLAQAERAFQSGRLRLRQGGAVRRDRPQQLGQPGEGQLGLGLDASGAEHAQVAGAGGGRAQQRGLADARLAVQQQRRRLAAQSTGESRLDGRQLMLATDEPALAGGHETRGGP